MKANLPLRGARRIKIDGLRDARHQSENMDAIDNFLTRNVVELRCWADRLAVKVNAKNIDVSYDDFIASYLERYVVPDLNKHEVSLEIVRGSRAKRIMRFPANPRSENQTQPLTLEDLHDSMLAKRLEVIEPAPLQVTEPTPSQVTGPSPPTGAPSLNPGPRTVSARKAAVATGTQVVMTPTPVMTMMGGSSPALADTRYVCVKPGTMLHAWLKVSDAEGRFKYLDIMAPGLCMKDWSLDVCTDAADLMEA